MAWYIENQPGNADVPETGMQGLERLIQLNCHDKGVKNLTQMNDHQGFYYNLNRCNYWMGAHFLINVYTLLGEEVLSLVFRDIYSLEHSDDKVGQLTGKDIYLSFLNHTPPDRQEEFRHLFKKLHGGPWTDANLEALDDHGNDAQHASQLSFGHAAPGSMDHAFDSDYFQFQAEEGKKYDMVLNRLTLADSRIKLYAPDGTTVLDGSVQFPNADPPIIGWTAPSSNLYFLAVDSPYGHKGTYHLSVDQIEPNVAPVDQHGDDAESAAVLVVGETVQGVLETESDKDYFRFQAEHGGVYRIVATGETAIHLRISLYASDGVAPLMIGSGPNRSHILWEAPESREYYLSVDSPLAKTGPYHIVITHANSQASEKAD